MPAALLVAVLLFVAAGALMLSPMPPWVCRLTGAAFALVGSVFIFRSVGLIGTDDEIVLLNYAVSGLAGVVILTFAAWKIGGPKAWRR